MRAEYDVENRLPGLTVVARTFSRFAHLPFLRLPDAAQERRRAICPPFGCSQYHAVAGGTPVEQQQPAAVRDPGLMPRIAGLIVDAEAFTDQTIALFVSLVQHAAAEPDGHSGAGDDLRGCGRVVCIPVPREEVELPELGGAAGGRRSWTAAAGIGAHRQRRGYRYGEAEDRDPVGAHGVGGSGSEA